MCVNRQQRKEAPFWSPRCEKTHETMCEAGCPSWSVLGKVPRVMPAATSGVRLGAEQVSRMPLRFQRGHRCRRGAAQSCGGVKLHADKQCKKVLCRLSSELDGHLR
ncbi:uncharacterized protein ACIBXB_022120 isoform 2-T3 [Morphnus guianensis]